MMIRIALSLLIALANVPVHASQNLYGCYAFEHNDFAITYDEAKKKKSFFMPLLEVYDEKINIILNKKLFGEAAYKKTVDAESIKDFDSIDTYAYEFKNIYLEIDLLKRNRKFLVNSNGFYRALLYIMNTETNEMSGMRYNCIKIP